MRRRDFPITLSRTYAGRVTAQAFIAGERAKGDERRKASTEARSKREAALVGLIVGLTVYTIGRILGVL